ncbi:MAG TPA: SDR family NAD(P)-dependent oxidoreductase [Alphaproteobacteria bacterium]|nr:SDR family NAD(P)-dependent oxidoreductase [Alphaproteobacteria bacterium]
MNKFAERAAIVTGAGRGIGLAVAERLAREGAQVCVVDNRGYRAERVAEALKGEGARAIAVEADPTQKQGAILVVERALEAFGALHILVNNVGGPRVEAFLDKEDDWLDELALNLHATIHCCRAALPHMVKQGFGRVVNIASDAALTGLWGHSIYAAGKGGVIGLSKVLAKELAAHRVTVNCVSPGLTATPPVKNRMEAEPAWAAEVLRDVPAGRPGEPEEIAAAVAFLASDEAAYITGQTLSVGGGLSV